MTVKTSKRGRDLDIMTTEMVKPLIEMGEKAGLV